MGGRGVPLDGPSRVPDLEGRLARARELQQSEEFGRAIGTLVRAVDVWENGEKTVPAWAIEARNAVLAIMEKRAVGIVQ
jgi:hypothetical protein